MSRILESFLTTHPAWVGFGLQETCTVLERDYDVPDSLFHKRMDFLNEVLDLKEFIKRSCAILHQVNGWADIAASLLHNQSSLLFRTDYWFGCVGQGQRSLGHTSRLIRGRDNYSLTLCTAMILEQLPGSDFMIDKGQEIS